MHLAQAGQRGLPEPAQLRHGQAARQRQHGLAVAFTAGQPGFAPGDVQAGQLVGKFSDRPHNRGRVGAVIVKRLKQGQHLLGLTVGDGLEHLNEPAIIGQAQHIAHGLDLDGPATQCNRLIQQRETIAR